MPVILVKMGTIYACKLAVILITIGTKFAYSVPNETVIAGISGPQHDRYRKHILSRLYSVLYRFHSLWTINYEMVMNDINHVMKAIDHASQGFLKEVMSHKKP